MNIIAGQVATLAEGVAVHIPGAQVPLPEPLGRAVAAHQLDEIAIGVRPEHLVLADDGFVPVTVSVVESLGHERNIACRLDDGTLVITRQAIEDPLPVVGETLHLTTEPEHLHVFDARSGDRVDAP
jgi:ABC-type sugar transport system ATPase subunit